MPAQPTESPRRVTRPRQAENIIRVVMYKLAVHGGERRHQDDEIHHRRGEGYVGARHHGDEWALAFSGLRPGNQGQDNRMVSR